jgi:hypothetical protein
MQISERRNSTLHSENLIDLGGSMSRLVALTVVISLWASPLTFAGESLMQTGARLVQQQVAQQAGSMSAAIHAPTTSARTGALNAPTGAALQESPGVLSKSGMSKRSKMMIYLAAGVGLAATAWEIDHHVLDVTPSSIGTRRDGCKPFCGGSPSQ